VTDAEGGDERRACRHSPGRMRRRVQRLHLGADRGPAQRADQAWKRHACRASVRPRADEHGNASGAASRAGDGPFREAEVESLLYFFLRGTGYVVREARSGFSRYLPLLLRSPGTGTGRAWDVGEAMSLTAYADCTLWCGSQYVQVGNAVPPDLAAAVIGRRHRLGTRVAPWANVELAAVCGRAKEPRPRARQSRP